MTDQTVKGFLKRLRAIYPRTQWGTDALKEYRDHLKVIPDADAEDLVRVLVTDHPTWMPSVGDILVAHRRMVSRTMRSETYAPPPPDRPGRELWLRQMRAAADRGDLYDWDGNPIQPDEVPHGA